MKLITHKPVSKQNSLLLEMETYELKFILSIFAKLQFIKLAIIMFENIEVWLEHHWSLRRSREEQEICAALTTTGIKFTAFLESLWVLVHLKVCVTSSTRGSALLLCPVSCLLECVSAQLLPICHGQCDRLSASYRFSPSFTERSWKLVEPLDPSKCVQASFRHRLLTVGESQVLTAYEKKTSSFCNLSSNQKSDIRFVWHCIRHHCLAEKSRKFFFN